VLATDSNGLSEVIVCMGDWASRIILCTERLIVAFCILKVVQRPEQSKGVLFHWC
jgi:hypothetical protein